MGTFDRLGETLTVLRVLRRMSQSELARRAGIRATQVSRYETGQVQPQFTQLERLLDALGVGLPEFLFALLQVERTVEMMELAERSPAEALVRDAVTAHWTRITDLHLRMAQEVQRVLREEMETEGESAG